MLVMIARRIALAALTLILTSIITMAAVQVLPGDACTAYLGRFIEPGALAQCRAQMGLDRQPVERYVAWATGLAKGDLGTSLSTRRPISELLLPRIQNSFLLGGLAAVIGIPLAVLLGVFAAVRRERVPDFLASGLSIAAMAMPEFVTSTLLIFVFAIGLAWLPAVTLASSSPTIAELLPSILLPVAVLVFVLVAHILRVTRANVINQLDSEHAEFARLRGVSGAALLMRHVLPGALPATVNLCAMTLAWLLCGVVVVERVFNYPGLGTLVLQSISNRDLPVVQEATMVFAAIYISVNLMADCISMALNPRLRRSRA